MAEKAGEFIAIRTDGTTKKKLQALANADRRSLSDYLKRWFDEIISNYQFEKHKDDNGEVSYTIINE
jgi:hypothetical protein